MIIANAHGRVNLIGEHTDYNGGYVLPTGIPQQTTVALEPAPGRDVILSSTNVDGESIRYQLGSETQRKDWSDYIQGATWILAREFGDRARVCGFELKASSTVPIGSGLSSSAALLVAVMRGLRDLWELGDRLDDLTIARLSQKAENEFVGARVGIMDPMAASLATEGVALFIDTRSLKTESIPIPLNKIEIAVIGSGILHSNAHGDYNQRRRECEEASERLGIASLRDLQPSRFAEIEALPEPLRRRVRHVVSENQRVLDAVAALRAGDGVELGRLFLASHESLQKDYEVSLPDIDTLVEIASAQPEVFGARLTGGGFGGSIVLAAQAGTAAAAARRIASLYARKTGRTPQIFVPLAWAEGPLATTFMDSTSI